MSGLLSGNCPRCRQGKMFSHPATDLRRFNKMNEFCPHCGLRLEPEPGFYQGAMYIGYAFTLAVTLITGLTLYLLLDNPSDWVYILTVIGIMMLLVPLNYRYSRIIYLYSFRGIKYDPSRST